MIYIPGYCLKFPLGLVLVFHTSKIRHVITCLPGIIFRSLRYKSLLGFSKMCCSWRLPSFISWACVARACMRLLSPYSFSWVVQVWLIGTFFPLSFKTFFSYLIFRWVLSAEVIDTWCGSTSLEDQYENLDRRSRDLGTGHTRPFSKCVA